MKKEIINGITTLFPEEGMRLTNGSTIGSIVCLGKEDNGSLWYEITEAEAEFMEQENVFEEATVEEY